VLLIIDLDDLVEESETSAEISKRCRAVSLDGDLCSPMNCFLSLSAWLSFEILIHLRFILLSLSDGTVFIIKIISFICSDLEDISLLSERQDDDETEGSTFIHKGLEYVVGVAVEDLVDQFKQLR